MRRTSTHRLTGPRRAPGELVVEFQRMARERVPRGRRRVPRRVVLLFVCVFLICAAPLHAQWGYNGLEIPILVNTVDVVPGPDNSVWVLQGQIAGPSYSISYLQRYDEDGYPLFEQPGIRATVDNYMSDPQGILPTSDGGVLVGFMSYQDEDYGNCIYGQRLSADGERLWGPNGAPVVLTELNADTDPNYPTICSDGADGFWCYFFDIPQDPIYVAGINSDGSMKVDEPILIREHLWPSGTRVVIAEGDSGGAYIAYITSEHDDVTTIQHVNADGGLRWPYFPPELFGHHISHLYSHIIRVNDGNFYVRNGLWIGLYNYDGELIWDDRLNFYLSINTTGTNPILMPDNSIGIVGVGTISDSTIFIRINQDGSAYYDNSYWVDLVHFGTVSGGRYLSISNDSTFAYCIYRTFYGPTINGYRAQKIDLDTGEEMWHDSVFVFDPYQGGLYGKTTTTSGNDLVLVCKDNDFNGFIFKVYEDGTVAGRTNSAPETDPHPVPPGAFRIDSLYPNPTNHQVLLEIETSTAEPVSISVYALTGRLVHKTTSSLSVGNNRIEVDLQDIRLAAGAYFVTVTGQTHSETKRMMYLP